jgi:dTDP-4-amino-4,6-dideoxygalactose transaminase
MTAKNVAWPVPFNDVTAQYTILEEAILEVVTCVQRKSDFILGQEVESFEQEFAAFCEVSHAIGVDSGMSALELILRAYGIGPGDEVITAANTFIATAFAISATGATPILIDAELRTYNMDTALLERAITRRTKAIIPVHLYGQPADMDPILLLARERGLLVIEDACQAHGARYKGRRVGSLGHAAAFSFYPAKNLGANGDGGAIVTNDDRLDASLRMLRNYGQSKKYHHVVQGYNRRLDTLQAAILRVKLRHLDAWNAARQRHAEQYTRQLSHAAVTIPNVAEYAEPVWHLYVIRIKDRHALQQHLAEEGISTGVHYPIPIHLQPAYQNLPYRKGAFPVAERCAAEVLSLPMYAELSSAAVGSVCAAISGFVAAGTAMPIG